MKKLFKFELEIEVDDYVGDESTLTNALINSLNESFPSAIVYSVDRMEDDGCVCFINSWCYEPK